MRIFVAEGHRLQRQVFCRLCTDDFGFTVAGEAGSFSEVIRLFGESVADLVILDLQLPGGGLDVAGFVKQQRPGTKILGVASRSDYHLLQRVERIGIEGFFNKQTQDIGTLRAAIQALKDGRPQFSPADARINLVRSSRQPSLDKILSERECHILSLIGAALSDAEIAERLGISQATAQTHRSHIMKKTGMPNSLKLARFALVNGFYQPGADDEELRT